MEINVVGKLVPCDDIIYFAVTIYIIIVTIKKTLKAFDDFKTNQRGV